MAVVNPVNYLRYPQLLNQNSIITTWGQLIRTLEDNDTRTNAYLSQVSSGGGGGSSGLPAGGTTGSILVKQTATSGDAGWYNPSLVDVRLFGCTAGVSTFDNSTPFNTAMEFALSNGFDLYFPEGEWFFTSTAHIRRGVKVFGCGIVNGTDKASVLRAKGAITLVHVSGHSRKSTGIYDFRIQNDSTSTRTNVSSIGIRVGDAAVTSSYKNHTVDIGRIMIDGGFYDGIIIEQEADNSEIFDITSYAEFGRSFIYHAPAMRVNSGARTACIQFNRIHAGEQDNRVMGLNKYGLYLNSCDSAEVRSAVINGFDQNIAVMEDTIGTKIHGYHTEDFRPFVCDYSARTDSTFYSIGNNIRPATPNGFIYTAVQAGTTDATTTVMPTSINALVSDGSVVWRCLSYHSQVWTSSRSVLVNYLTKPTSVNATGFGGIYRAVSITTGITGSTEPYPWPTSVGERIADGGVEWELACLSEALYLETSSSAGVVKLDINGALSHNHQNMIRINGRADLTINNWTVQNTGIGDTYNVIYYNRKNNENSSYLQWNNCQLRGNYRPYTSATNDTRHVRSLFYFTPILRDNYQLFRSTGDGIYSLYLGGIFEKSTESNTSFVSVTPYTFSWRNDKIIRAGFTSGGTVNIGMPLRHNMGREVEIYNMGSGGTVVSTSGFSLIYGGVATSTFALPNIGDYVRMRATNASALEIIGYSPWIGPPVFNRSVATSVSTNVVVSLRTAMPREAYVYFTASAATNVIGTSAAQLPHSKMYLTNMAESTSPVSVESTLGGFINIGTAAAINPGATMMLVWDGTYWR